MEATEEKLGQALAVLRKEAGLSQDFLAQELHHDQTYISKIEHGKRQLTFLEFVRWCRVLGLEDEGVIRLVRLCE